MTQKLPPKPTPRPDKVSLWRYLKLFRADILSAQPARLYHAWMAEFRTPFFHSFLINDPKLLRRVLSEHPDDFPKSDRIGAGLRPLLGESVFLTNGETWRRQRRIIDPAFEGGRLRDTFAGIMAAGRAGIDRLEAEADGNPVDVEAITSHIAADVIFRTLFSIPIEDQMAARVFAAFQAYQRSQPILNLAAFVPGPRWMPRFFRKGTSANAKLIRQLIKELTEQRLALIEAGDAPDDLATKIMTTEDPLTGQRFSLSEMVDQVAIFFLAGHETSASALAWALYLLADYPEWQDKVADEVDGFDGNFAGLSKLKLTRDVFRETLRLYPPVPMMVRAAKSEQEFRGRRVPKGGQIVMSPWHLHRHDRLWINPDVFDPGRWADESNKVSARDAYMPFSAGPRVCTGAGFAMIEGVVLLSQILSKYRLGTVEEKTPTPAAHLTVRSTEGIWLFLQLRKP